MTPSLRLESGRLESERLESAAVRLGIRLRAAAVAAGLGLIAAGCPNVTDPFAGPSPFTVGLERTLSTDLSVPADSPTIAWDGDDFLVVWSGRRGGETDLFAMRVGPAGDPIDQSQRPLITSPGNQNHPSLAWDGDEFLLVWEDDRSGVGRLYGAHVTSRLEVVEPRGFQIAGGRYEQSSPLVTWTGSHFAVIWTETVGGSNGLDLYEAVLKPTAGTTVPQGMPLAAGPGDQFQPAVAWGPDAGVLAWSDDRSNGATPSLTDLFATRIGVDGHRLDPNDLLVTGASGSQSHPSLAWDGTQFDLVWLDQRQGGALIYGTTLTVRDGLRDSARNPGGGIPITSGPAQNGPPVLAALLDQITPSMNGRVVGIWTERGREQQLVVGRVWTNGFEPMPSLIGPVMYIQTETAPSVQIAATGRGELLMVWAATLPGSGTSTQIVSKQVEVKE
jgi:hypothetical protein